MLLFFCFVMKRQIMNITCYYKKICKNTFFLYLFSLLWWKTVYFWLVTALSFTQHFFPSGGFHAQGVDAHPINIFGFPLKFWKNGWWCYHREGFECKNQKYFIKKTKSLDFAQIWVNTKYDELEQYSRRQFLRIEGIVKSREEKVEGCYKSC